MSDASEKQGCLGMLFPFLRPKAAPEEHLPYRLRDDFLSPAEFSFYKVLAATLGPRFIIQSKVRLADIFFVSGRNNEYMTYFNKISQRHVDFLVCDADTMKPLLGIELDDASHRREKRQKRDAFVEKVFQAAQLPLLRFPVRREYNTREIAAQVAPFLKDLAPHAPEPAATASTSRSQPVPTAKVSTSRSQPVPTAKASTPSPEGAPLCPKCGIPMVLRTATQGLLKGKQFYGCANYPRCREIKPVPNQTAD